MTQESEGYSIFHTQAHKWIIIKLWRYIIELKLFPLQLQNDFWWKSWLQGLNWLLLSIKISLEYGFSDPFGYLWYALTKYSPTSQKPPKKRFCVRFLRTWFLFSLKRCKWTIAYQTSESGFCRHDELNSCYPHYQPRMSTLIGQPPSPFPMWVCFPQAHFPHRCLRY